MLAATLILALAALPATPPLPQQLGAFVRGEVEELTIPPRDLGLYNEYGWQAAFRGDYADAGGKRMRVDAFRFRDAEGAHAAYLSSRPAGGVSPWIWNIDAVTGGGLTVMEYRNYVLRFYGALPSISSSLEEMLAQLPGLTPETPATDLDGRYLDALSTRSILGPVSLERFAPRVPPSVAAFRMGAKGRAAKFETPAGAMLAVVFEYPTEEMARDRAIALAALPGAMANVNHSCVGVIFEPPDSTLAEEILQGYSCGAVAQSWASVSEWDGYGSLDQGIGMILWSFLFGALLAGGRRLARSRDPFPERLLLLRL